MRRAACVAPPADADEFIPSLDEVAELESGWKVPLDQSVAKLPLTAPEPKAVVLE